MPPVVTDAAVSFVDLTLDVVQAEDGTVTILDEDEVDDEAAKRSIPPEFVASARRACDEVAAMMKASKPPFDGTAERWLRRFMDIRTES